MIEPLTDRRDLLEVAGDIISFPVVSILATQGETYNNVSLDASMSSFDAIDYYFQVLEEDVVAFQINIGDTFTKATETSLRTFKITNKLVDGYGWVKLVAILVSTTTVRLFPQVPGLDALIDQLLVLAVAEALVALAPTTRHTYAVRPPFAK